MTNFVPTERTKIKRVPTRGSYNRDLVYDILDEALVANVGFLVKGQPFVIPTAYGRVGDKLYIHGSSGSRMIRAMAGDIDVCVTVTILDGLVLARSAFHHSMNYRSVVLLGKAGKVTQDEEKLVALKAFSDQILPGRWEEVRSPNQSELNQTSMLALPLTEASAKTRTGPPSEEEEDYSIPVWAGEIPLRIVADAPVTDPQVFPGLGIPDYAKGYTRPLKST